MLEFFEGDGSTPLGRLRLGEIRPGQTYSELNDGEAYQVVLRNVGSTDMQEVAAEIIQVASYSAYQYALIAVGETQPAPGSPDWVAAGEALQIGDLAAEESVNLWVDMSVPIAGVAGDGQMVRLRAYGLRAAGG